MTLLLIVTAASFVVAVMTARYHLRPLALAGAFLLRIGVPSYVGDIGISGTVPPLHVSTILILCFSVVWPLATQRTTRHVGTAALPVPPLCHVILGTITVCAIAMSQSFSAMGAVTGLLMNQIVAPYIFGMLVVAASVQYEPLQMNAGRLFASCCVFESCLALSVKYNLLPQPYVSWYPAIINSMIASGRHPGTLDHPLTLGLLLAAGIPMTAYFRSRATAFGAVVIIVVGITLTQSRIAVAGAFVAVAYLLTVGSKSLRVRITMLISVAAGYAFLSMTGILQGLLDRVQYDAGSTQDRARALQLFTDHWSDFKVFGIGMELNKDYFLSHGLTSSGESATICYMVGIGIPLTLLYLCLTTWMIIRGIKTANGRYHACAAAVIVFTSIQFYSSIATESAAGMILWTTIGIALATPRSELLPQTNGDGPVTGHRGIRPRNGMSEKQSLDNFSAVEKNRITSDSQL